MADEILPNLSIELPDVGADDDAWGNILNDGLRKIDQATTLGILTKTLSNVNVTLTNSELTKGVINLVGAITANVSVIIQPSPTRLYHIRNATTGAFTVTVRTPSGTGVQITQGFSTWVYSDGVNIVHAGTSLSNTFYINNGNVGIGTFGPTATLSVQNTGAGLGQIARFTRFNGSDNAALRVDIDAGQNMVYFDSTGASSGGFTFRRGGADSVVFDSSGRVGVGVQPSQWAGNRSVLQIKGGSTQGGCSLVSGSENQAILVTNAYSDGTSFKYLTSNQATMYQQFLGAHSWLSSASGTAGGNVNFVEVAQITPSGFFKSSNTGSITTAGGATSLQNLPSHHFQSSENQMVLYAASTNAGPNTEIYRSDLPTTSTGYHFLSTLDNSGAVYRVLANGNVQNINNSYGAISDAKLKENITDATPKLNDLMRLRVVNYNLVGTNLKQIGLIAQDVEKIFPALVEQTPDINAQTKELTGTSTKSIKYSVLIPIMLKAIQELQELNNRLSQRISDLEDNQ